MNPTRRPSSCSHLTIALGIVILGLSLCTPPLGAAEKEVRSSISDSMNESGLTVADDAIQLSLSDAVTIALERNLNLQVQRFNRARSFVVVQQEMGIYDLNLGGTFFNVDETSASASNLDGADVSKSETKGLNLQIDQLLPTGGTATLDWQNSRRATNSFFSSVNPAFNIDFDLVYNQPLLRNLGRLATERNILVARTNSSIARRDLALALVDTVEQVEAAYWSLVEALEQLKVAQQSLSLAEELHEMNKVQVEVGTLAPLELIQSEVGIATRKEEIIRSEQAVGDSSDQLRQLLNLETDGYWDRAIVPTTDPRVPYIDVDLNQAIGKALASRLEIEQQELILENLELDRKFFKNQKLPQLDFQLRYGFNGLGGDVRNLLPGESPFDPNAEFEIISGGYSDAFSQITDRSFKGWQAAVSVNYPLQNRRARALATASELALKQGQTSFDDLVLGVRTEVRRTERAVRTAQQQIESAEISRRLAEENLDAEQKRYENGLSTSFQVLEIQEDLSQASQRLVSAITGYRRALVSFFKSTGELLTENEIRLLDDVGN